MWPSGERSGTSLASMNQTRDSRKMPKEMVMDRYRWFRPFLDGFVEGETMALLRRSGILLAYCILVDFSSFV